jgi:hypothetical protein
VKIQTRTAWVTAQGKSLDQVFELFYVLLALSVIISVFGMINSLVLAVFERTRELEMLRAITMSRRQMRRMIRHESIVTAPIGAGLGLPSASSSPRLRAARWKALGSDSTCRRRSWPTSPCSRWWRGSAPPSSRPGDRRD